MAKSVSLHIALVVAAEAARRGDQKVGITGTRWLPARFIQSSSPRGIAWMRPSRAELGNMRRIIMDELVAGIVNPASTGCFQGVIQRMKNEGCDPVLLGCTETPLLISDANSAPSPLDSTRLLVQAALQRAV